MIGLLLIVSFAAAQGAVVFVTAKLGLRLFKTSHWLAKVAAMAASYVGWVAITIGGYAALGGEGGLMDGFGFVLFLCFTALISSFVYASIWALFPRAKAAAG